MGNDLLVEIGGEEIPARMVAGIAESFAASLLNELRGQQLLSATDAPQTAWAYTPRRLVFECSGVAARQADREEQVLGPPAKVAFAADGSVSAQGANFAAKFGAPPSALQRVQTPKGDYVALQRQIPGRDAAALLGEIIPQALRNVQLPKAMQWNESGFRFIRPLRWLTVLLGGEVVPVELAGLRSGRTTEGHRTLGKRAITLNSPAGFADVLRQQFVLLSRDERRARIEQGIAAALRGTGLRVRQDDGLLETLINLTEFPTVVKGDFDPAFLDLPAEVLVTVMRDHQKYFAVEQEKPAANGEHPLAPHFLAIMDLDADREGLIRHGHERVLRARFNDARFFWQTDRKRKLEQRIADLEYVTFQAQLGSYAEKTKRVVQLSRLLAQHFNGKIAAFQEEAVQQAARLLKCDLTTEVVKEFTELQGMMGGLYARAEGLGEATAVAIYDQYKPLAADAEPPRSLEGAIVSLADKLDTLAGMFALGEIPSGSRDPYALRRQANGVVRIIDRHKLPIDLQGVLKEALAGYDREDFESSKTIEALLQFFREREQFYFEEIAAFPQDEVRAVLAVNASNPLQAAERLAALHQVREQQPQAFAAVAAALKRMRNIVRKESWTESAWQQQLLKENAEKELASRVANAAGQGKAGHNAGYAEQLLAIAALAPQLEEFFNAVRVNDPDSALRANRLSLLVWAGAELSRVADFSEIVIAGERP